MFFPTNNHTIAGMHDKLSGLLTVKKGVSRRALPVTCHSKLEAQLHSCGYLDNGCKQRCYLVFTVEKCQRVWHPGCNQWIKSYTKIVGGRKIDLLQLIPGHIHRLQSSLINNDEASKGLLARGFLWGVLGLSERTFLCRPTRVVLLSVSSLKVTRPIKYKFL